MEKTMGVIIGIAVGLLITFLVLKFINKDGKSKTKYDEMQLITRGKAYTYAFWTVLALELIMSVVDTSGVKLPINSYVDHFMIILVGIVVQVSYCIWNNAYVGLNNNMSRFAVFSVVISLFNFGIAFYMYKNGKMLVDGVLQDCFINFLVGCLFILIGIEMFAKMIVDKSEAGENV